MCTTLFTICIHVEKDLPTSRKCTILQSRKFPHWSNYYSNLIFKKQSVGMLRDDPMQYFEEFSPPPHTHTQKKKMQNWSILEVL